MLPGLLPAIDYMWFRQVRKSGQLSAWGYSFSQVKTFLELTIVRTPPSFLSPPSVWWSEGAPCQLLLLPLYLSQVFPQSLLHISASTSENLNQQEEELGKTSGYLSRQETYVYKKRRGNDQVVRWAGKDYILRKGLFFECKGKFWNLSLETLDCFRS